MTFQDAFKQELINRIGFNECDWRLPRIANLAAKSVDSVDDPVRLAKEIIDKVLEDVPTETVRRGAEAINNYLFTFGYDCMVKKLLKVVAACNV